MELTEHYIVGFDVEMNNAEMMEEEKLSFHLLEYVNALSADGVASLHRQLDARTRKHQIEF